MPETIKLISLAFIKRSYFKKRSVYPLDYLLNLNMWESYARGISLNSFRSFEHKLKVRDTLFYSPLSPRKLYQSLEKFRTQSTCRWLFYFLCHFERRRWRSLLMFSFLFKACVDESYGVFDAEKKNRLWI